jgi:hypothetical protein
VQRRVLGDDPVAILAGGRGRAVRSVLAGVVYGIMALAAGTLLGTLRVLFVAPQLGPLAAVVLELPLMLVFAWWMLGPIIHRAQVPRGVGARAVVGVVGFGLLLAGEAVVAGLIAGATQPAAILAVGAGALADGFATPAGLVGLAGQVVFAGLPLLRAEGGGGSGAQVAPMLAPDVDKGRGGRFG